MLRSKLSICVPSLNLQLSCIPYMCMITDDDQQQSGFHNRKRRPRTSEKKNTQACYQNEEAAPEVHSTALFFPPPTPHACTSQAPTKPRARASCVLVTLAYPFPPRPVSSARMGRPIRSTVPEPTISVATVPIPIATTV